MSSSENPPAVAVKDSTLPPHVLIFPLPLQGHVNSMLKLAEILCIEGIHVTFLLSDYTHDRLLKNADVKSRLFDRYKGFQFATISDGLPNDHPRSGERSVDIMMSLWDVGESLFRNLMTSTDRLSKKTGDENGEKMRPITCLIMDGVLSFAARVSEEMKIPYIYFRTVGAGSFWANFCIPDVIQAGELPLKREDEDKESQWRRKDMDLLVKSIPGMEGYLRRRDLPAFFRVEDVNNPVFLTIMSETRNSTKAKALILNTFEDLEAPILNQIRKRIPILYSIGPLHDHLKTRIAKNPSAKEGSKNQSGSFWQEDGSCIAWLDTQEKKSVIYVSFGSVAVLTKDEVFEFWYGLVNSGQRFLWVMRPDSITGENGESIRIPEELEEGTKARGYMVGWAPQEEVLMHPATGGFLTHSGWNSTIESVSAGVPMVCWPYFADQTINSRFVEEVWKIGLDMKDTCDRVTVEKMVRELMDARKDEFLKKAELLANLGRKTINEGGSSYSNLDALIQSIRAMIV